MQDLNWTVTRVLDKGFNNYTPEQLESHLNLALQQDTPFDRMYGATAAGNRFGRFLEEWEGALRKELCRKGQLKDDYAKWIGGGDSAAAVKSVATTVLATINPALAVSSVGVLFTLWLFKVGANQWCSNGSHKKGRK